MAKDFRADRIRTGALIGSASVGQPGILIYSASVANDYDGNRTDSAMLSSVGRDVGVFVSGSKGHMVGNEWYPLGTGAHGVAFKPGVFLVGGDFHVSGTIRAEHIVGELDPTATGSLYLSGALFVGKGATINTWSGTDEHHDFKVMGENYLGGETILFADSGTGKVSIGGSSATGAGRQPGVPIGILEIGSGSIGDSNIVIHSSNAKSASLDFYQGGVPGARIVQSGSNNGNEDLYIDNLHQDESIILRTTQNGGSYGKGVWEQMRIGGSATAKDVRVGVGGATALSASVFQVDAFNGFNRAGILVNTEQNSTSYPGIKVYAPATVGAVINAKHGLSVTQNASNGSAASFFRNQAEAGIQPLVSITEENASNTQIALKIRQDGTGDILGLYDSTTEVFVVEDGGYVGIGSRAGKAAYNLDVGFDAFSVRDVGLRLECHSAQSASISFSGHSTAVGPAIVYEGTSTTGDGNFVIVHSSSNKEIRIKNHNDTMFARFREPVDDKAQVLILSGGGFLSSDPSTYADANFVVSGSVNSRTGSARGTAVFMGDVHVSGNISSDLTNFGQWGRKTAGGAHLYPLNASSDSIAIGKSAANALPSTADIMLNSDGGAVFNEQSNNVDFRVESNNETHMLFVTASDRIGIGTSNPGGFLSVDTNTQAAGVRRGVIIGHDYGGDTYFPEGSSLTVRWLKTGVKDTNVFIQSAENNSASLFLQNYGSAGSIANAAGLVHTRETAGSGAKTLSIVNSQSAGPVIFKAGSNGANPSTMLRMQGINSGIAGTVFNEDLVDLDFTVRSSNRSGSIFLDSGNSRLFILSGSAADSSSPNEADYADVAFFVSGTRGTKDSTTKGTALFGGDLVSSGSIYANNKLFVGVGQTGNKPGSKPGTAQIYDVLGPELSLSKVGATSGSLYFRNQGAGANTVGMKLSYASAETGLLALTGSDSLDKDFIFKVNSSQTEGTGTDTEIMRFDASANSIGIGGVLQATGSKVEVLVNDAEDKGGLKIDFNETGVKIALEVDSEAAAYAIKSTGKYPAYFSQDISSGYGLGVIRNIAEAGSLPLVNFQEDNTAGEQPVLRVTQDGTGNIIELKDGATQVFTVADGGHVGIKNDYPVADLVVGGGSTAHSIHIDAGNGQSGSLAFSKNGGTPGARISYNSNEDLVLAMTGSNGNNKDIIFQTNASGTDTEVFRVDGSAGKVAIGVTSNTVAKLLVKAGSTDDDTGIKIDQDDSGERALWIDSEGQAAYITCKEGLQVIVDQDNGYGLLTSRNKSTVSDPLVKIRDQLGDQAALRVIQESTDPDAYAIEIANIAGTKAVISGSGQASFGNSDTAFDAMLLVKGINRGDGIVLKDAGSSDTVVKIYESVDDGVVDVYANNSVTARIHGNGTSFVPNPFGIGVTTPEAELEVKNADSGEDATVMITARADRSGSIAFRKGVTSSTAAAVVLDSDEHLNLINSGSSKNIILETTSGQIITSGTLMAPSGLSGSLTHLSDGTSYLIAGSNITISTGSSGAVTVASAADILGVTAGTGLSGGGTSGTVTLNIDNSVVATISGSTFTGATKHTAGLSGSLTHLSDGTPYLRPGNNITIESGSAGYITITAADGGDTAASYLVLSATSSLDSERVFTAGTGISATDAGAGGAYTLAVDNSVVATVSGSTFTGAVKFNNGLSGSLTHLQDGTPYILGSTGITISSASNGAVTITGTTASIAAVTAGTGLTGGGVSGTVTLNIDNSTIATLTGSQFSGNIGATGSLGITGNAIFGNGSSLAGNDNNFFVSGSKGSANGNIRGTAVFGGDLSVSGSIHVANNVVHQGDTDTRIGFETNKIKFIAAGDSMFAVDATEGNISLNSDEGAYNTVIKTANKMAIAVKNSTDQVLILSGGGATSFNEADGSDVNFYISGSVGSRSTSDRGTSVFGGDVHISGSITSDNTTFGQWTDGGSFIYPADSSGAETVIIGANTTGAANIVLGSDGATQFNKQNAAVDFRVRSENKSYTLFVDGDKDAVTMGSQNLFGDDAFLNVSGSILSRGVTSDRGLAVFGGDTYVSGALLLNKLGTTPVQGNIGSNAVGIYAKDDSGTTKLFYMDDAGTEIQVGSGGGGGGPGDANATFLLVSATGSLNAERVLAGGAGISTTDGGAGNSFTVAVDYAGADSFILAATNGAGITVDSDNDKLVIYDNDAAIVKYVTAGQVGKTYTAGDGLDLSGTEFSLDLKSSGGLVIDSTELAVSNAVVATLTGSQFSGNVGVTGSFGVTGGALFKGNVTLGNATGDDLTFTGYAASNIIPKTDNTYDLGSSGNRWANIYTGDLHLRNDKGNWTIQEDSDKLIVINNLTGKKYKMMLSPLEDEE
jgi:hypothetical protein